MPKLAFGKAQCSPERGGRPPRSGQFVPNSDLAPTRWTGPVGHTQGLRSNSSPGQGRPRGNVPWPP
jgi:hypothetical protein